MSTHYAPTDVPVLDFVGHALQVVREGNLLAYTFTPDLSPAEVAAFELRVAVADSPVPLTTAEYAAVRAQMQILRDLRQLGRNPFMALTAADRDRRLYDATVAVTEIFLALLRD